MVQRKSGETYLDAAPDGPSTAPHCISRAATPRLSLTNKLARIYELSDEGSRFPSMEGILGYAIFLAFGDKPRAFIGYHVGILRESSYGSALARPIEGRLELFSGSLCL